MREGIVSYFRVLKSCSNEPKDQNEPVKHCLRAVDLVGMSKLDPSLDWNLVLIASSLDGPERVLRFLAGAVSACGGWVLNSSQCGEECAEIDFEFPRVKCVEIYSVLIATGVNLSQQAHLRLTELCQCTSYLLDSKAHDIARLHLTVYTHAASALDNEEADEVKAEAA